MGKLHVSIQGMHCHSCEVLLEQNFRKISGVRHCSVDHTRGEAVLSCDGDVTLEQLQDAVKGTEYTVQLSSEGGRVADHSSFTVKRSHLEAGAIFLIVVAVYYVLRSVDLLPESLSTLGVNSNVGYGLAFVMGLVASVSTCLAVTGGLLVGISARYSEKHSELSSAQRFRPHLAFNAGRLVSYGVFGALIGLIGSAITLSPFLNGILIIVVSMVMILLGLQLLGVFPSLQRFAPRMPKFFAHKIHEHTEAGKATPFLLGAATFFLPCGFTQALQLYSLSAGSPLIGGLVMFSFALGTLPALLGIGVLTSYVRGVWQHRIAMFAGALVLLLGFATVTNGLALVGVWASSSGVAPREALPGAPIIENAGPVVLDMKVKGLDYEPSTFTIHKGVPVEWRIDGSKAQGCAQILTIPKLGITRKLSKTSITTIKFTPKNSGTLYFTCGMGMAGPGVFNVV